MTAFYVGSLSFEPLVGLTNNFPEMLAMMRVDVQCLCLTKVGSRSRSKYQFEVLNYIQANIN